MSYLRVDAPGRGRLALTALGSHRAPPEHPRHVQITTARVAVVARDEGAP